MIVDAMYMSKELKTIKLSQRGKQSWTIMDHLQVRIESENQLIWIRIPKSSETKTHMQSTIVVQGKISQISMDKKCRVIKATQKAVKRLEAMGLLDK